MKHQRAFTATFLLTVSSILAAQSLPPGSERARQLFSDPESLPAAVADLGDDPGLQRARFVTANLSPPGSNRATLAATDTAVLRMQLFDDVSVNAVRDELQLNPLGSESWIGHVEGATESSVILVHKDGVVSGAVSVDGKTYKIRYGGPGVHVVSEVDASLYAPENNPIPVSSSASSSGDVLQFAATDSGALFDLMVVYTRAARNAAGGTNAIQTLIQLGATETNMAYQNSGVVPRLRLVHMEEVRHTESGNMGTDLSRLTSTSDGVMDDVHALRATPTAPTSSCWSPTGGTTAASPG